MMLAGHPRMTTAPERPSSSNQAQAQRSITATVEAESVTDGARVMSWLHASRSRTTSPAMRHKRARFATGLSIGSWLVATERYVPYCSAGHRPESA